MSNFKSVIGEFLQKVPKGTIVDAHAVINFIWAEHPDLYLANHNNGQAMNAFHGNISNEIDSFDGDLLEALSEESYSRTLNGNYTTNKCWKRI